MESSVAYILTNYPRLSHTFIAREINDLESLGVRVERVSMNAVLPSDLETRDGRCESEKTFYIKTSSTSAIVKAVFAAMRMSPLGFARLAWRSVRMGGTDLRAMLWRLFYLVEAALVWNHLRTTDARHLHAHFGLTPATIAWFTADIGNFDRTQHWTWSFTSHGFQDFVDEREAQIALKTAHASFVVGISDFTRSQLMRLSNPQFWDRFEIVRCGIDVDEFAFRAQHPDNPIPRVVTVARLSPEKGHVIIVNAVKQLRDRGVDVIAEFVGGGPFRDEIKAEAERLGVSDRVEFTGELEAPGVVERLNQADVFCLPSFAEGLPVSIMEAMAIGVPVITTYISGIPELAQDHRRALTLPAGNVEALADAITELINDRALGEELAKAARAEIELNYSSIDNVARLAALFANARAPRPADGGS